jgi:hypothetical protein
MGTRHRTRPVPVSVPKPPEGTAGATSVAPNKLAKPILVSRGEAKIFASGPTQRGVRGPRQFC